MHFTTAVIALVAALGSVEVTATPVPQSSTMSVSNSQAKLQRKEWRKLTNTEKTNYINAVKCMSTKGTPVKGLRGAQNLYESFAAVHADLVIQPGGDSIHGVAHFLPWHRYFLMVHEYTIRNYCGYTGAQPYWDWTLDVKSLSKSPVFDPTYGFGGNGTVPKKIVFPFDREIGLQPPVPSVKKWIGSCITTGPFKDIKLNVGPGNYTAGHCLTRDIQDTQLAASYTQANVDSCLSKTNFLDMWLCTEFGVGLPGNEDFHLDGLHAGPHIAVGGEMANMATSPMEPLFMLHHANLDRIWDKWQKKDTKTRTYQIQGNSDPARTKNATLDTVLKMQGLAQDKPVKNFMDTALLNYEYV